MKSLLKLLIIPAVLLFSVSCNKKKEEPKPATPQSSSKVVGTWLISELADDDNKNKVMDSSERYKTDSTYYAMTIKFNADGTTTTTVTPPYPQTSVYGTWSISADDKNLQMDDSKIEIIQLTETDMIWQEDIGSGVLTWTILKKL